MSSDNGSTWTETIIPNSDYNKWLQTVVISRTGKYIYCGGGGGGLFESYSSNDFGVTFTIGGSPLNRTSSTITSSGLVISVTDTGYYYSTNLETGTNDTLIDNRGVINGLYSVSHNPFGDGWISVSPNGFIYNPNSSSPFPGSVLQTTPEIFEQVIYGYEGRIWARSTTSVYTTKDMGISWNKIYTGLVSGMCLSDGLSTLYLLLTNGDIVRQYRTFRPTINVFSGPYNFTSSSIMPFNNNGSIMTMQSFFMTPGIYQLYYGFKMGSSGPIGMCTNQNILWGLSSTESEPNQPFNHFSKTDVYSIDSSVLSTWQSFSNSIIVISTTYSEVSINAKLLNLPIGDPTDTYLYDSFMNIFAIGDV
jgi:hypothetical protein